MILDRPVETGGGGRLEGVLGGGGGGGVGGAGDPPAPPPPPQIFANFHFWSIEKIVLKWKVVKNYKTSLNSPKFIDIYNIIIVFDTSTHDTT